jgi:hypothetical protein
LCLQEPIGTSEPTVQTVKWLMEDYKNGYVTASKSGKLKFQTFQIILDNALKRYVEGHKIILILDSWGGQTKFNLMINLLMRGERTCQLRNYSTKIYPLLPTTQLFFFRQLKTLITTENYKYRVPFYITTSNTVIY